MTGKLFKIRFQYEPLRSIAFGSIGAGYVIIGSAFTNPISILKIYNGTDEDVLISQDGTIDHDIIPSGSNFVIDITTNKTGDEAGFFIKARDGLFVKQGPGGAPTTGSVFVTSIFQG